VAFASDFVMRPNHCRAPHCIDIGLGNTFNCARSRSFFEDNPTCPPALVVATLVSSRNWEQRCKSSSRMRTVPTSLARMALSRSLHSTSASTKSCSATTLVQFSCTRGGGHANLGLTTYETLRTSILIRTVKGPFMRAMRRRKQEPELMVTAPAKKADVMFKVAGTRNSRRNRVVDPVVPFDLASGYWARSTSSELLYRKPLGETLRENPR